MIVTFGKEKLSLTSVTGDTTIEELFLELKQLTKCDELKVVAAGKTILPGNNRRVSNLPNGMETKLVVFGTPKTVLEALDHCPPCYETKRVINDLTPATPPKQLISSGSGSSNHYKPPPKTKSGYGFGAVETLPGFHDEARARDILYQLASDIGVMAVMEKHKFNVGTLCELYPDGFVGVDEVCVLGLNQNKGSRILLRLRTDDLEGFRNMETIRKVLFHELSHNVHSEHDQNFYKLMRQIEKEAVELDWTKSKGHKVQVGVHPPPTNTSSSSSASSSPPARAVVGTVSQLGGVTADLRRVMPARLMAGLAATMRLGSVVEGNAGGDGAGDGAGGGVGVIGSSSGSGSSRSSSSSSSGGEERGEGFGETENSGDEDLKNSGDDTTDAVGSLSSSDNNHTVTSTTDSSSSTTTTTTSSSTSTTNNNNISASDSTQEEIMQAEPSNETMGFGKQAARG